MEKSGFARESNVPSTCSGRTSTEVPQAGGSHLSLRLTFEDVTANSAPCIPGIGEQRAFLEGETQGFGLGGVSGGL